MTCKCKVEIEAKLLEHYRTQQPDHMSHEVTMEGYGYTLGDRVGYRPFMPVRIESQRLIKGGGTRKTTARSRMFFSFCPFCGASLDPKKPATANAPASAEVPA